MPQPSEPTPVAARRSSRSAGGLTGTATVPGDKSVSHRALILGALTVGETRITGLLEGGDVLGTAEAMRAFGAQVTRIAATRWRRPWHGVTRSSEKTVQPVLC